MKHAKGEFPSMSDNAYDELYRVLLEVANDAPMEEVANCIEVMTTVLNRRMHDWIEKVGTGFNSWQP